MLQLYAMYYDVRGVSPRVVGRSVGIGVPCGDSEEACVDDMKQGMQACAGVCPRRRSVRRRSLV